MSLMGYFGFGGEEEDKKDKSKFTEACWLMDYIDFISAYGKQKNQLGFTNFKVIDSDPTTGGGAYEIISKLTSRNGLEEYLNVSPAAMTALQPKVRLYKLIYGSQDSRNPIASPEFIFDDFYSRDNIDDIFSSETFKRIGGAGISDVSWKLNGKNPAESDKVIEVSMKFEFQTAADLLGSRFNPADGSLSGFSEDESGIATDELEMQANFIDLILHPPSFEDSQGVKARISNERGGYVPKFYRIRLDVGWAIPQLSDNMLPGMTPSATKELLTDLRKQNMSLILNLVSHSFDIKENGAISLSVDYIGALESSINGNDANILALLDRKKNSPLMQNADEEIEKKRQRISEMNEYIECLRLNNPDDEEAQKYKDNVDAIQEDIKDGEEETEQILSQQRQEIYKQFLTEINKEVQTIELSESEIDDWLESITLKSVRPKVDGLVRNEDGTFKDLGTEDAQNANDAEKAITEAADGDTEALEEVIEEAEEAQQDPEKGYVQFLFLGDILNAACTLMNPHLNKSMGDSVIISGPVVIHHPRGSKFQINLADIPISYSDFQAFFLEVVVRKQIASYPLKQFFKDVLERLVKKVLQPPECFDMGKEQRTINIAMNNFTITKGMSVMNNLMVNYTSPTKRINIGSVFPVLPELEENEEMVNCLLFHALSFKASELIGEEEPDRDKGIYHFYIGAEGGIVKSIDYTRTDVEGLREARQADARNLGQIRDVYNASVKLMGNTLFYPGMKVFLNPPMGFGEPQNDGGAISQSPSSEPSNFGSLANLLGIGGYYDVISVDSSISRGGQYETTLDCIFAQSGGSRDSIEARCSDTLSSPKPVRDIPVTERVTTVVGDAIDSVNPFSSGGNE
jgi:hypothetical protein